MLRKMSVEDVLALNPCWDEKRVRAMAKKAGLTKPADPREVLRRLRGYVCDADLVWLFRHYLAKHHPGRAMIASSWRDTRTGHIIRAKWQRQFVANGHLYTSDEWCAHEWAFPALNDIERVMNMTYAEALAVTE